ncbi:MAG TPA: folate family ECF transporter S component [Thermoclostridium sp.]
MLNKNNFSFFKDVHSMVLVALFIAIYVVLSLLRIYVIPNELRVSLTFMPIAWASMMFGPVAGGVTGALGDIIGWAINPVGPYFPGYTVSGFVAGVIYGLFLYKKEITWKRVIFAAITITFIVQVGLSSLWMNILTGKAYKALVAVRLVKALIMLPVKIFLLYTTGKLMKKFAKISVKGV